MQTDGDGMHREGIRALIVDITYSSIAKREKKASYYHHRNNSRQC
jgi:hypothetical protein